MNWTEWNRVLYSGWAPVYDPLVAMLEGKRRQSMAIANIQPGERVLLLGAGTGLDLKYLPASAEIHAIDITPAMIARLRRRSDELGLNVKASIMDAQQLEYPSDYFDAVILHFVLAVIPDPLKAMAEVERVLRPEGRAVILNKFADDENDPSLLLKAANVVVRPLATDITCRLRPIVSNCPLKLETEQKLGMAGMFKVAVLRKTSDAPATSALAPVSLTREKVAAPPDPSLALEAS